jgi:hypothetical protein
MRGLRRLRCEDFTLFHVEIATDVGRAETPTNDRRDQMIVETTCCARENVCMR